MYTGSKHETEPLHVLNAGCTIEIYREFRCWRSAAEALPEYMYIGTLNHGPHCAKQEPGPIGGCRAKRLVTGAAGTPRLFNKHLK